MEWLITLLCHMQPFGSVSQGCSAHIFPDMLSKYRSCIWGFFFLLWGIFVSCKIEPKQQPAAVWAPSQEGRQCCGSPLSLPWHRTVFVAVTWVTPGREFPAVELGCVWGWKLSSLGLKCSQSRTAGLGQTWGADSSGHTLAGNRGSKLCLSVQTIFHPQGKWISSPFLGSYRSQRLTNTNQLPLGGYGE